MQPASAAVFSATLPCSTTQPSSTFPRCGLLPSSQNCASLAGPASWQRFSDTIMYLGRVTTYLASAPGRTGRLHDEVLIPSGIRWLFCLADVPMALQSQRLYLPAELLRRLLWKLAGPPAGDRDRSGSAAHVAPRKIRSGWSLNASVSCCNVMIDLTGASRREAAMVHAQGLYQSLSCHVRSYHSFALALDFQSANSRDADVALVAGRRS